MLTIHRFFLQVVFLCDTGTITKFIYVCCLFIHISKQSLLLTCRFGLNLSWSTLCQGHLFTDPRYSGPEKSPCTYDHCTIPTISASEWRPRATGLYLWGLQHPRWSWFGTRLAGFWQAKSMDLLNDFVIHLATAMIRLTTVTRKIFKSSIFKSTHFSNRHCGPNCSPNTRTTCITKSLRYWWLQVRNQPFLYTRHSAINVNSIFWISSFVLLKRVGKRFPRNFFWCIFFYFLSFGVSNNLQIMVWFCNQIILQNNSVELPGSHFNSKLLLTSTNIWSQNSQIN